MGPTGTGRRPSAPELLDLVLDPGSLESWDQPVDRSGLDATYQDQLRRASEQSGLEEAVLTGAGTVGGRRVAVVVGDFRFLGGSVGRAAADRVVAAVRRATAERIPLLASTSSGGTRMQEGTPAFLAMVDVTAAVMEHRAAGLPYLAYLRHPTTGGVLASWGSLAQVTAAEPGAFVGFLGPRVHRVLSDRPAPTHVQTAEHLAACGVVDAVVSPRALRRLLISSLRVLVDAPDRAERPDRTIPTTTPDAWASVLATREPHLGLRDLLRVGGTSTTVLRGTGEGERDDSVLLALTRLAGQPCVVVGHDPQGGVTAPGPAAFRTARRGIRLADELGLPLVTVIDTDGAELSARAEEGALAGEVARCIAGLVQLRTPNVSVLLGPGAGGGALALLPARATIAVSNSWLAPLPPEGASAIAYGDTARADVMARAQHIRAADLAHLGWVDRVVETVPGESLDDLALAVVTECSFQIQQL